MTELFDVYDKDFHRTGKIIERGTKLEEGEYNLVVDIIICNSKNEILLQKRSENKLYCPGFWGLTGGAANAGEDSLTAIIRETREEVGIELKPENIEFFCRQGGVDAQLIVDIFTAKCEVPLTAMKMQAEEVCELKWCDKVEFLRLVTLERFMPTLTEAVKRFFAEK